MLENAAESPASGARFVGQPACWPKRWIKTEPPPTRLDFTHNFAFYQNQKTLSEPKHSLKKDKLYFEPKRLLNEGILYANQNACWKRTICIFTKTYAEKRRADFENLAKPTRNKTEATKQSQSKPPQTETQAKNLETDFNNSTKPTWNFADERKFVEQKKSNLKTCLLKTRLKLDLKKRRR